MSKKFTPREFQKLMIDYIDNHDRCAVWAGMGTGKTSSTLTALDRHYVMGETHPTLVLAPLAVARTTWPEEAKKWRHLRHLRVSPVVGSELDRIRALEVDASVFTISYESMPWLVEYMGDRWPFKHVVADESTRLKSFRTRQGSVRAKALSKVAHTKVKRFTQLTGTPSPNGLGDLWGQIWMLDAGKRLGRSYQAYIDRWFKPAHNGYGYQIKGGVAEQEIMNRLKDICLTIRAEDWFDLEEPIVVDKWVELPRNARKLYKDMEDKFFFEIEGHAVEAAHAAVMSQKLLQIANGAAYIDPDVDDDNHRKAKEFKTVHNAKIDALESIVNESGGMPILVSVAFRSDMIRLQKAFSKSRILTSTNAEEVTKEWNRGKIPMVITHPASAGHGLNMQDGGNILVYFGHNWNLEHRLQILERIGPMRQMQSGNNRPVFVYNILAHNTIDELIKARVETKKSVQDLLLEAMRKRK